MLKVYCYNRCTTCKKALKWLDEQGIGYKQVDIKENHPGEGEIREFHAASGLPLKRFWNTSGLPYREIIVSPCGSPDLSLRFFIFFIFENSIISLTCKMLPCVL